MSIYKYEFAKIMEQNWFLMNNMYILVPQVDILYSKLYNAFRIIVIRIRNGGRMGFLDRMINGNPNKPDLEVEDNPNPIKSYFEILKIKLWDLIKMNLLFSLFVIPTAIWVSVNISIITREIEMIQSEGVITNLFLDGGISGFITVFFAGLIPCLLVIGVALPSLNYITRSYAREFHVWMMEDFFEKIKENWKQSLLYMLILGVAILIMYMSTIFYTVQEQTTQIYGVLKGVMLVMSGLVLVSTTFVYPLMVTFELKFKDLVKNSFLLTIAKLPQILLILLITAIIPAFFLFLLMTWDYGMIAFIGYLLIFGFSFTSFTINSYTNSVFEKIIVASGENEADKKPEVERKDI